MGPRTRVPRRSLLLLLVSAAAALTACGDDDQAAGGSASATSVTTTAPEVPVTELAVTAGGSAGEYTYTTDLEAIEEGRVRLTLTNDGAEEHQAMLLRFTDGADFGAFAAAAAADPTGVDALGLVEGFGGPNAAAPGGGTSTTTQDLEPGDYLLICLIPDGEGTPHAAKGMLRPFTVTPSPSPSSADEVPLVGDGDIGLVDFGFEVPEDVGVGDTVTVTNDGDQGHELALYRLHDGATVTDFGAASEGDRPADPVAGTGLVRPGGSALLTLPDEGGRYVLACFIPDVSTDGTPHIRRGMLTELEL